MERIVREQTLGLLEVQGPREIGHFVGHDQQVASQEIFDFLSILNKLANQCRILRERSGGIRAGQSPTLGLLHHPPMAILRQGDGGDYAGHVTPQAPFQKPATLPGSLTSRVDQNVRVDEDLDAGRNGIKAH